MSRSATFFTLRSRVAFAREREGSALTREPHVAHVGNELGQAVPSPASHPNPPHMQSHTGCPSNKPAAHRRTHLRMSLTAVVLEAWGPPVAMAALISSLYILQG